MDIGSAIKTVLPGLIISERELCYKNKNKKKIRIQGGY